MKIKRCRIGSSRRPERADDHEQEDDMKQKAHEQEVDMKQKACNGSDNLNYD